MVTTTTTYNELMSDARLTQLNDKDATTWSSTAMIYAFNQAQKMLLLMRPDAGAYVEKIPLVRGSRQYIPSEGMRLLKVIRNIKLVADEEIYGRAILQVNMSSLDSMFPYWHIPSDIAYREYEVHEFCFDPQSPKHFYIYPSCPTNFESEIEIEYCKMPPSLKNDSDLNDFLPFDSIFDQPLIELMLYKLLSGDRNGDGVNYLNSAKAMLGLSIESAERVNPRNREV